MEKTKKTKLKIRKDGDFVPPDGGWGWMVVVAAGFSNLSAAVMIQQFGLLFRDKFNRLGISSSQTTSVVNINVALTSCVGLANGPMFKAFSYRQVSVFAAIMIFASLLCTSYSSSFGSYIVTFSILYGTFYGINSSANALALNTYWKERRRLATSLSWTTTGLGPMLWPHIITALFATFGEDGTILIIAGMSLHAVACALLLQPVEWHSKITPSKDEEKFLIKENQANGKKIESGYFSQGSKLKNLSAFSSQYLYNEDDPTNPGYEIIDPGVPMMIRSNDGYFSQSRDGSNKNSRLNSSKPSSSNLLENRSRKSSTLYLNESKKNSAANLGALAQERELKPKRRTSINLDNQIPESEIEDCPTLKAPQDLKAEEKSAVENLDPNETNVIAARSEHNVTPKKKIKQYGDKYNKDNHSDMSFSKQNESEEKCYMRNNQSNQSFRSRSRRKSNNFNYENEVLKQASLKLEQYLQENESDEDNKMNLLISKISNAEKDEGDDEAFEENVDDNNEEETLTFWQKLALFFDLDLLKDFTFVNLMLGITLANFNEINFSILTPFILGDFNIPKPQVAFFMSLLAGVDLSVRFCIPFVAGKIGWDNNSFFLVGVIAMAIGRLILAYCQSYPVLIIVAVIIGFGKGLRTVFIALVIPTHVPLHKLPGATGIQLLTAGIVFFTLGPLIGWVKEITSVVVMLHCLNIFTYLTALSWGLEKYIRSRRQKRTDDEAIVS